MQLKFKKICLFSTIFIYCISFLLQSNFVLFQTWAQERNVPRVNIVAILVDDKIYDGISGKLKWYATDYIQKKLSDTKALVIPLDLTNIHAYDIHRMMENIYFDGLSGVNSSLIGLVMFGDIPLPVVNQDGYMFPTVYPYVDFENQKYVWDSESEYFVPNGNPAGQAEIWHGLVNYGDDIDAYINPKTGFFAKLKQYVENPSEFIGESIWYDDFIAQKNGFLNENYPYYRNRIMFAEDLGYQRYSPLMKKIFRGELAENALDIVSDLETVSNLVFSGKDVLLGMSDEGISDMHSTKMIQQEIENSFISDYNDLFSNISMSIMRENVFAGGRWIEEYQNAKGEKSLVANSDSSSAKLQLKDDILLGNENLQGLIENLNELMENMIDKKIEEQKYSMDIVIPVSYQKTTKKRVLFKRYYFVDRYENYYFGNNARLIDNAEDLSIYRGTYRNLSDLSRVSYNSLLMGQNPIKGQYEKTDLKLKSIGGSYDIFSNQVEGNRGYTMLSVEDDLNTYDENKTEKQKKQGGGFLGLRRVRKVTWPEVCTEDEECELLYDFAQRWRGGASPINLDTNSISNGKYALSGYKATDSWRPIFDMGGFQSLSVGADEGMVGKGWINGSGTGPQRAANSFKAYIKYASPTQREGWVKKGRILPKYEYYENHTPDVHKSFSSMDYFNLDTSIITSSSWTKSKDRTSSKIFNIYKPRTGRTMEQYSYKVISSVVKHKSTTDVQINGIDRNRYGEDGTLSMYYNDISSAYKNLQGSISDILSTLSGLVFDINSGNVYINDRLYDLSVGINNLSENTGGNDIITGVNLILEDIDSFVDGEHDKLSQFYDSLQGLYVENIISVMDSIINVEGGTRSGNVVNLTKIGFLPVRLTDIGNIKRTITGSVGGIISSYDEVRSGVKTQQGIWNELYVELKNQEDLDQEMIDEISYKFNNIFWIENVEDVDSQDDEDHLVEDESEGEDEEVEVVTGVMLTGGTARELINTFNEEFKQVDIIFSNLFEVDTVGPKIEIAAKNDEDFISWLRTSGVNYGAFSQSDWIIQYAQWVKGPGYDSDGARRNHDILEGISEHITGMNVLTPDRPIDSPRYVSMQSVAGNEIRFIYPDLFKVEVYAVRGERNNSGYDIHELLTGGQIKKNLVKYLLGKVDEYNKILENECRGALGMNVYYNNLKNLGYIGATPSTGEHGCNVKFTYEEFVNALGGEKMLDIISETLYYQSLTNKTKLSTGNVAEDIELIKKSFSLNEKRGQVLKDYLIKGNEKIKNLVFEIPGYEVSGYEVAYINSDGEDYIFSDDDYQDAGSNGTNGLNNDSNSASLATNPLGSTSQEKDIERECNIPSNGKLPLFSTSGKSPWLEGFKCWWEQTKKEPFKIKVSIDSALGDMLTADSFKDFIRNGELGQVFNDWGESWSKYGDSWDSLLDSKTSRDADLEITQMQMHAELHNQEVVGGEGGVSNILANISNNVKINNTNLLLSDSSPESDLRIESPVDIGSVTVSFEGTGDGCIKLNSEILCNGRVYRKTFNPSLNPFTGVISSYDHVAGKVALIIKIGVAGQNIEKVVKYTVSPGDLYRVDIEMGDKKTIAGMITPISVVGYDKDSNEVSWGLEKYDFTVSQGRFLKDGAYQSGFSTNDFRNLNFYYQAPLDARDGSVAIIQIKSDKNEVIKTYNQPIASAKPEIKMMGKTILRGDEIEVNETYQLLPNVYVPWCHWCEERLYSGGKLIVQNLKTLEIDMKDSNGNIVDVDSQVLVTSQNGLLIIGQVNKDDNGNEVFFETSKHYMKSGHVLVYYYPTTVAGNDIINIDIPGLDTRVVNLTVSPRGVSDVQLNIKDGYVKLDKLTDFEIFGNDEWGNSSTSIFYIQVDPNYVTFPNLNVYRKYEDAVIYKISLPNGYGKTLVYGTGAGLTSIQLAKRTWEVEINGRIEERIPREKAIVDLDFSVVDNLLPNSGLNIMYLNYFGNDRGNQWGYLSTNNKYIESLMKKSEKIITTTTLLASEDKIKKVLWSISPGFKISSFENLKTLMVINDSKLNLLVGSLSDMQLSSLPSFNWMTVTTETVYNILNNPTTARNNYIFFIPKESDYSLRDGILYDADGEVAKVNKGEVTLQLASELIDNGDNVWDVIIKGVNYGKLIVHYPGFKPEINMFTNPGTRYFVSNVFSRGSTDTMSSVGVFDGFSEFGLDSSYKSIQNSDELDEKVGFLGKFKNITLFAEGEIVGEATRKYGSELLINLGDPVLSRKDSNENVYGTDYDGGIGQEILNDPEKSIFGVYQIDFNKDGLKDWLVVYLDGSFKLAKNYGGNPNLRELQELMRIAVNIKNIFVGDADGNGYEDILVLTNNNQIRAYLNDGGIFDVDGKVVCLNQNVFEGDISSTPSNLGGLNKFYVEDMDLDGKVDIVTYDEKGYIKVFYGGKDNKDNPTYLSTEKYACDSGWYDRQVSTVVTALGVQIFGGPVYDNSMIRWVGMDKPNIEISENDLPEYGIKFDARELEGLVKAKKQNIDGSIGKVVETIMDTDNFDVTTASKQFINNEAKYVDVTLYENTLVGSTSNNYVFAPISYLDPSNKEDRCLAWKNYSHSNSSGRILMDGDIVTVTVRVKASQFNSCVGSFGDIIQGPWNVYYDKNGIITGFEFLQNGSGAIYRGKDGNFSYLVDNIRLSPGQTMAFRYNLEYHHTPLKEMSITHKTFWSNDDYPDIKLQSVDGCEKNFDLFENKGRRLFEKREIKLQNFIDAEYETEDDMTEDYAADVISYGSDVNKLPGIVGDRIERIKLLEGNGGITISDDERGRSRLESLIREGGLEALNLDINLSLFDAELGAIEDVVDDITKGMCNGFSFGGSNNCKGLPVPFNQAFLAPGKYHLFGCWDLPLGPLEGGLPTFFFPGTLNTPFGPIMFPWGLKSPKDGFLWVGGGVYPSFIRIYAAPTLTAQLGIAICMGPYMDEHIFPSPLSDVAGNCVVFAIKPQCKGGSDNTAKKKDKNNPNEIYENFIEDVRDSGVCLQSQKGPQVTKNGYRSSPFELNSYSAKVVNSDQRVGGGFDRDGTKDIINWKNLDVNGGSDNQLEFDTDFLGIINLETSAYIGGDSDNSDEKNSIFIGDIDVLGGDFSINKIKGGIQQGIRKILIDNWLDPQIRYIVNQLTKMHINIKIPDLPSFINQEVQTLSSIGDRIGTVLKNEDEEQKMNPITKWSDISYGNLTKLNQTISNPFESLASLLNESNVINISVEPLTVKVPMIFSEDINAYEIYLQQWLSTNEAIFNEWKSVLSGADLELQLGGWTKLQNQIYANLVTLQKYRNFPFEIYEWIHVIDRYLSEIASLINNTIGYLSYWTSTNSQRFVGYVDAIVLIINIIKTYQLLINFSVEWGQNCGSCTKDTYDQYSCKLSILCNMIQLPIIQIPNFKLPNITIDLTDIDLGLDIILPDFNFQPVKIKLPEIPNLPEPPAIGVNVQLNLPDIPLIPEPPELPELPSFIPEIELELPILPPAPELPKLPNEIEALIDAAKLIGKIYCIVKGKFGLVGEGSVKAKIEQLTQRTYEVKWIDTIMDFTNFSFAPIRNYGLDYEISTHVDLQFDFSLFYDYLDTLTKTINNLSTSAVNWVNKETNSLINENPVVSSLESIDGLGVDVNVQVGMADTVSDINVQGLESDDIEYVDYESAKSRLEEVLAYFKQGTKDTTMGYTVKSGITSIENQINKVNRVESNSEGLDNLKKDVMGYLDEEKGYYDDLAELINRDYDGFLAMVDSKASDGTLKGGSDTGKLLTFNVQLFNVDSSTRDVIDTITKANPYETILGNKSTIVDGYRNAINSNTADNLGLSQAQYLVLRDSIKGMKDQVTTLYSVVKPVSSTELIAKNSRVSTNKALVSANDSSRLGSNMGVADVIDPSALSKGIYDKINKGADSGKITKIVYSDSFTSDVGNQYYHTNNKKSDDIVLWDDGSVFLKCFNGECGKGSGGGSYYKSQTVKEIPFEETWLTFDRNTKLKIADGDQEVKNLRVIGQTYDALSFSWDIEGVDGYLIKLVERIDNSYEKSDYNSISTPVHYVLALPEGVSSQEELVSNGVKLELLKKTNEIQKLLSGGDLLQVVYYDIHKNIANITISNVGRMWYYARVATLSFSDGIYNINSPWSNQIVAGKQALGDEQPPSSVSELYRPSVGKVVSQGNNLDGYVGTKYELRVNWSDNVALSYISLLKDGKVLDEKYTSNSEDVVRTSIPIHAKVDHETFTSIGVDQYGNRAEKIITVSYSVPDIEIIDVSKNSDGETISIKAELSQDIDQGNVSFQRRRGTEWKSMKRKDLDYADFPLAPGRTKVNGSPYSVGNDIAIYDKDGKVMALMNSKTAEIKLQSGYKDLLDVRAIVQNSSVLQIINKTTQNSVFSISIPAEKCVKIEANNYEVVDLPEKGKMGMFNGGKAVYINGNNILFASPTCHLYSEIGLEGTYDFDRELEAVVLTLYQPSDFSKSNPIKVWVKAQPFIKD